MEPVTLRPHHLVRGVEKYRRYDEGKDGGHQTRVRSEQNDGYGSRFHQLHHQTLRAIIDSPDVPITITDTWDDLCKVCDRKQGCDYEHEDKRDLEMVTKLGFNVGEPITSGELLAKMRRRQELIQCVVDEIVSGSPLGKYLNSIYHTLF